MTDIVSPARSIGNISNINHEDNNNNHNNSTILSDSPHVSPGGGIIRGGNSNPATTTNPNVVTMQQVQQQQRQHVKSPNNNSNTPHNISSTSTSSGKTYKDYTLNGWKEYAVDVYGNRKFFQESEHGRRCIESTAVAQYKSDMISLKKWADGVETTATQLLDTLDHERAVASLMKKKVMI